MQNKKGLYILIGLISIILIFFFTLFFVHENTLENGILFTVSFGYEDSKEIKYNFYNQSGKIEKIEEDNSFLLEKTDYNSVKLLRKITKNLKESKNPSKEKGITIFNGQNKRYYLLPFNTDEAKYLSELIIDGYIHAEYDANTENKTFNELYIYRKDDTFAWTKDGKKDKIIHTYSCQEENCKFIYLGKEYETVLWDKEYFHYDYVNKEKEKINIETEITSVKYLKQENRILGMVLNNQKEESAYYDIEKKELFTKFKKSKYEVIDDNYILETTNNKEEEKTKYNISVYDRYQNKIVYEKEIIDENNITYQMKNFKNSFESYYALIRNSQKETTYQILNSEWKNVDISSKINGFALKSDGDFLIFEKSNPTKYKIYNTKEKVFEESQEYQKVLGIYENNLIVLSKNNELQILDNNENVLSSLNEYQIKSDIKKVVKEENTLKIEFQDGLKIDIKL